MPKITVSYDLQVPVYNGEEQDWEIQYGWIDQDGLDCTPQSEDETPVSNAMKILTQAGAWDPSNYPSWNPGTWYTDDGTENFKTGTIERRNYHLEEFTQQDEEEIYNRIVEKNF
jgi:hypothetical protein